MRRTSLALAAAIASSACHSRSNGAPHDAAASATPPATAGVAPVPLARPIAGVHLDGGLTLVAGLRVSPAPAAVAVVAVGPAGEVRWTRDVVADVTATPSATLAVLAWRGGALVVFRGRHGGADGATAVWVSGEGIVSPAPVAVGAATCAAESGVAWIDRAKKGAWVIRTLGAPGATASVALTLPEEREPALLCARRSVFAFGDGEDDVTLTRWSGAASSLGRVVESKDFGGDDERAHEVYAVNDVAGVVRVGASGAVAVREIADHASPWRRLGERLVESDDVILVDADARLATLVFTREASGSGGDLGGSTVEALVWMRDGTREATYRLAPADESTARGPYWSGPVSGGVVIGWVERPAGRDPGARRAATLAYRVVSGDALGELRRVSHGVDDLVDAGCDAARCYAIGFTAIGDGAGGSVEVVAYP